MGQSHLFTSESVTEGHPDKIADQISDGVLDAVLADDPYGRVACETLITTGQVMVAGEISTSTYVDIPPDRAQDDPPDRLRPRQVRLRLRDLRRLGRPRRAVARHRPGRRPRPRGPRQEGRRPLRPPGRRRPGPHVRLRERRDRRADAAADHPRPPPLRAAGGHAAHLNDLPAPRRQVAGHRPLRGRRAAGGQPRSSSRPSTRPDVSPDLLRDEVIGQVVRPVLEDFEMHRGGITHYINPTGTFVVGGPARRRRPDRAQDHRRHLRRHGPPRRRRLLGQGPVEGRPLGRLRRPLGGEERRGRGLRASAARCRWPTRSASPTRSR